MPQNFLCGSQTMTPEIINRINFPHGMRCKICINPKSLCGSLKVFKNSLPRAMACRIQSVLKHINIPRLSQQPFPQVFSKIDPAGFFCFLFPHCKPAALFQLLFFYRKHITYPQTGTQRNLSRQGVRRRQQSHNQLHIIMLNPIRSQKRHSFLKIRNQPRGGGGVPPPPGVAFSSFFVLGAPSPLPPGGAPPRSAPQALRGLRAWCLSSPLFACSAALAPLPLCPPARWSLRSRGFAASAPLPPDSGGKKKRSSIIQATPLRQDRLYILSPRA